MVMVCAFFRCCICTRVNFPPFDSNCLSNFFSCLHFDRLQMVVYTVHIFYCLYSPCSASKCHGVINLWWSRCGMKEIKAFTAKYWAAQRRAKSAFEHGANGNISHLIVQLKKEKIWFIKIFVPCQWKWDTHFVALWGEKYFIVSHLLLNAISKTISTICGYLESCAFHSFA